MNRSSKVLTTDHAVPYDYLVLATGTPSNYFGHDVWQRWTPSLKSLRDALTVRHAILGAFEAAENEPDPEKRQALLTFVLVGGGPTGVELAGAIAELAHRALAHDFRWINPTSTRTSWSRGSQHHSHVPGLLNAQRTGAVRSGGQDGRACHRCDLRWSEDRR